MNQSTKQPSRSGSEIAIIGMACRFPGANDPRAFWRNLAAGVESLTRVSAGDLTRAGLDAAVLDDPHYVPMIPALERIEWFDAGFFGYTPLEAEIMDPQQRLFLECAWEAFEHAGQVPDRARGRVGVFTGSKTNTYLFNLFTNRKVFSSLDHFQIALGNDLACMATRVAYKFDLRGPSYALHTACSTSLVATHLACQSLLLGECEMALAGGAAINVPQNRGYRYQKGGILSPDGHCRSFDAAAQGSNFGNGVGAVLLKRLEDALADRDPIHAIILGSASNNDGARKASYTAPGVEGQTSVLLEALACAGVNPETISYLEAHGTATDLGDSIEMLALTEAYRASTRSQGFCAIGSVKTNIGHIETAAGIAGLIKTALALEHRQLPPSLHFERPNPRIDFENSPFYVNAKLADWPAGETPRRAGVSSFGIGSANAHVILEEAPARPPLAASRPRHLLLLSARSETALDAMTANLARHFSHEAPGYQSYLADAAYTLQVGRKVFPWRRAVVCESVADAIAKLEGRETSGVLTHAGGEAGRPVVFLFPGLGDHYPRMGEQLYRAEPVFREVLDRCASLLQNHLGYDIRQALYGEQAPKEPARRAALGFDFRRMAGRAAGEPDEHARRMRQTAFMQPVTFALEYALARQWMAWGIEPRAMLGYSLGEYVAACLAGVLGLEDALGLVATRARLIQELPEGAMLAIPAPEAGALAWARQYGLSLAAVNGPSLAVLAGPLEAVAALERELAGRDMPSRRLATSHAFHSVMMAPVERALTEYAQTLRLNAPAIPYVSNLTGTWIRPEEATDPAYWARHMSGAVRFDDGIRALAGEQGRILLDVGPGQSLTSLVKQHPACDAETARLSLASLPGAYDQRPEAAFILETLGKLWLAGQNVDWTAYHAGEPRNRVALPAYAFERQRYWVEGGNLDGEAARPRLTLEKKSDVVDWLYRPAWTPAPARAASADDSAATWLLLDDGSEVCQAVAAGLAAPGRRVVTVAAGEAFARLGEDRFAIHPGRPEDYLSLLEAAWTAGAAAQRVVHFWTAAEQPAFDRAQDLGFYSLLYLAQAIGAKAFTTSVRIDVFTTGLFRVTGREQIRPEKATVLGPVRVIPREYPKVICRCLDFAWPEAGSSAELARQLIEELRAEASGAVAALREGRCWIEHFEPVPAALQHSGARVLREGGAYLITGGLGALGLALAQHLATVAHARLTLVSRTALPDRAQWRSWLDSHPADDPLSRKMAAIERLEAVGAEVLTIAADVADEAQMRGAVELAEARFGALRGAFHLAGVPGGGIMQLKTRRMAETILAPKVRGALALERALAGRPLDFVFLYSSIESILGEFGQVDYCAANAFLDALAQRDADQPGAATITVNWDIWNEDGISVRTEVPAHLRELRAEMLAKGMTDREGFEAFDRVLASGLPQAIVSAQDLAGRIALGESLTGENLLRELRRSSPPAPSGRRALGAGYAAADGDREQAIAATWQRVLGAGQIGRNDSFFDLGGNSLLALQLVSELSRELALEIAPVTLFEFPTVSSLARHLYPPAPGNPARPASELADRRKRLRQGGKPPEIAVIGMAGRFPGAPHVDALWANLRDGVESLSFFTEDELRASGVEPEIFNHPLYVRAGAVIDGVERFDAALFGFSPRDAEIMDPQHRIFLECAWEALERAGYDSFEYPGSIGVFAGSNMSAYLLGLHGDARARQNVNVFQAMLGNDKDSLTTMVSYKMNLRGPSVAVQTFCSTSLVAVHLACQSLRAGECDMALAGGVRVVAPERQGYLYEPGGLAPVDGHTRSFDARATGSIFGNGAGIVCLKRLEDALADGDQIHAVIKASAINNDGSQKAGYTAPSVAGQVEAIAAALEAAGIDAASIGYVEAHGSATELGDPIEVAALSKAFRRHTGKTNFCAIGSVKSNFGHLDRAAGVTALIKTVLSLEHGQIPPSINFESPNPNIDFASSPFYVNTALRDWPVNGTPRRASVNSLGVGGTNVHVVLEQAPPPVASGAARPWQLLTLSARTEAALEAATGRLADHLASHPDLNLADAAYTLQVGRRALQFRRMLVCENAGDARAALAGRDARRLITAEREEGARPVVFLFAGLGGQYVNMGRGLYHAEPVFRDTVDRCCEILRPHLDFDLRRELYPEAAGALASPAQAAVNGQAAPLNLKKLLARPEPDAGPLDRTAISQPLLFTIEYALAQLCMSWGIHPQAMAGYSLGEYVAACLADVFSLEDALKLVALRARLIEGLPPGALLAVGVSEQQIGPELDDELSLMAVNGPEQCVVSGPAGAVAALERRLQAQGVACRRLRAAHAFHSRMMLPLFDQVEKLARGVELRAPRIPYLSNVTGGWIRAEEAMDPVYWARHMCEPVRFAEQMRELLRDPRRALIETGPPVLSSIVLQNAASTGGDPLVASMLPHFYETQADSAYALQTLGRLWLAGIQPDWEALHAGGRRRRVALPTYPFERRRYWVDTRDDVRTGHPRLLGEAAAGGAWYYAPSWRRAPLVQPAGSSAGRDCWVVGDSMGLAADLAHALEQAGRRVERIEAGPRRAYAERIERGGAPGAVVCLWAAQSAGGETAQASVTALLEALATQAGTEPVPVWMISDRLHDVTGEEELQSGPAQWIGFGLELARQFPRLRIRNVDISAADAGGARRMRLVGQLAAEALSGSADPVVAWRAAHRWVPALALAGEDPGPRALHQSTAEPGCVLVCGLGSLGLALAEQLAGRGGARLALLDGAGLPERGRWDEWLAEDPREGGVSALIERLRALEARSEMTLASVDFSDAPQVASAAAAARDRFGAVAGVVYIGGAAPGSGDPAALRALAAASRDWEPCFRLILSPLREARSRSGGAAEALALDAFAAHSARNGGPAWVSVTVEGDGFCPDLDRLLRLDRTPQAIVAGRPLAENWNKLEALLEAEREAPEQPVANYPRPSLRVSYVAPRSALEKTIAGIWRDLLGVDQVGVHDNFLDLGGDSLVAVRLASRLRDALHQDVPMRVIFEVSTVAELAAALGAPADAEAADLAALAAMVNELSDEEVERELERRQLLPEAPV